MSVFGDLVYRSIDSVLITMTTPWCWFAWDKVNTTDEFADVEN